MGQRRSDSLSTHAGGLDNSTLERKIDLRKHIGDRLAIIGQNLSRTFDDGSRNLQHAAHARVFTRRGRHAPDHAVCGDEGDESRASITDAEIISACHMATCQTHPNCVIQQRTINLRLHSFAERACPRSWSTTATNSGCLVVQWSELNMPRSANDAYGSYRVAAAGAELVLRG